jgi:hypothetical protein
LSVAKVREAKARGPFYHQFQSDRSVARPERDVATDARLLDMQGNPDVK